MSRFDSLGESELPWGLFEGWRKQAVGSKRGKQLLTELRDALLAMPQQRLIAGVISRDGEVCAIGALAAYRRLDDNTDWLRACGSLERDIEHDWEYQGYEPTIQVAKELGFSHTLADVVAEYNDEVCYESRYTPEARYEYVLRQINRWIERGY